METEVEADAPLDYALFKISPAQNRYEAYVVCKGITEKLASGVLEHLVLHISPDKVSLSAGSNDNFKLEVPEELSGLEWFTKSCLSRFLHIVGSPELLNNLNAILEELVQLEETRKFQLSPNTQGLRDSSSGNTIYNINYKGMAEIQNGKTTAGSSDATKNELLRAVDIRVTALKEELFTCITRASGNSCSTKQIADLAKFCGHFGAISLRNSLLKCSSLSPNNQADIINRHAHNSDNTIRADAPVDPIQPEKKVGSPIKFNDEENLSRAESEKSSNSSGEDEPRVERSRPLIRSASPKRSASPMRRVQIGRSGSHRSTALTIKSLGYYPAREKMSSYRAAVGDSSEDEESNLPVRKPENNPVRRMSVQDAISLFENKQRDQKSDFQKLRTSQDGSVGTNKSVLRRWSAGMGESSMPETHAGDSESNVNTLVREQVPANNVLETQLDAVPVETTEVPKPKIIEKCGISDETEPRIDNPEVVDGMSGTTEWTQKKEEELNQMQIKLMEAKPKTNQIAKVTRKDNENKKLTIEKSGSFYDHYKEKRDEKLRGENAGRKKEKEAQFKAMFEMLDKRKAGMLSKPLGNSARRESAGQLPKARRNSLPSLGGKKESPDPVASRKTSTKSSQPLPATRNSWSSAPSPRPVAPSPTKTSGGTSATGSAPNRRKSPTASSSIRQTPKAERSKPQQKSTTVPKVEIEQMPKVLNQKKQTISKSAKSTKAKPSVTPVVDSNTNPKPSFYNKVTRKSAVTPIETKPFLRKGTGVVHSGSFSSKAKAGVPDDCTRTSGSQELVQEDVMTEAGGGDIRVAEETMIQTESEKVQLEVSENIEQSCEVAEVPCLIVPEVHKDLRETDELSDDFEADEEESMISPAAWVEQDPPYALTGQNEELEVLPQAISVIEAPISASSPRIRQSLSEMLLAESCESDIIEWGNAENSPALIYQKGSPKGFKRLLKFARKSKGDTSSSGWASPSIFSEGEEDADNSKGDSKRSADALLRKAAHQAKGFEKQKMMLGESFDSGISSKRSMDGAAHEISSARSNVSNSSSSFIKVKGGKTSSGVTSSKGSRSFFSLSTFRSSK